MYSFSRGEFIKTIEANNTKKFHPILIQLLRYYRFPYIIRYIKIQQSGLLQTSHLCIHNILLFHFWATKYIITIFYTRGFEEIEAY